MKKLNVNRIVGIPKLRDNNGVRKGIRIITLLLLLSSSKLFAQFSVSGNISDNDSKEFLVAASVQIENTFLATTADAKGNFVFKNLKQGDYNIIVSYVGYKSYQQKIKLNKDITLTIQLSKSILDQDAVVVEANRADEKSGMAFTKMSKEEIAKQNLGQDIPYLLSLQPSVVSTSDAGAGIGYTGIRIRGTDASRINVTINGIPLNDAESQQLYWVDLPDLATSLDNIQITRGVGTSTNGSGAFGASIDLQTEKLNANAFGEATIGGGSFNSFKRNFKVGTGLLNNHFAFEARLSKITSDGYVDRATSDLSSYFISGGYYGNKTSVRVNLISGKEKTYQAWNGVPESRINNDAAGMVDFIDRNYLDSTDASNLFNSGRTYNYFTYDNQTDNYKQNHYQLFITQNISLKLSLNISGFYSQGEGYYEEYEKNADYTNYNMTTPVVGVDTITLTNLVRQKWLDNDYYGGIFSLMYDSKNKVKLTVGGGYYQYDGKHFNKVVWAEYYGNNPNDFEYYNDDALKKDGNIFAKMNYAFAKKWNAFADVQYRYVEYHFNGYDVDGNFIPQNNQLNFFNPKAGITFNPNLHHTAYASFSVGNHEPSRDDYVNSSTQSRPKPETLYDLESGYHYQSRKFSVGLNYFLMMYKDQLVLTGKLNDVGEYTRTNVEQSFREGVELDAAYKLLNNLELKGVATISKNEIKQFNEYLDDYDNGDQIINTYNNTDIALSPNFTANGIVSYSPFKNLSFDFIAKHVGEQFLDNTGNESRKLNSFTTCDLKVGYVLDFANNLRMVGDPENIRDSHGQKGSHHFPRIEFNLSIMNLFNKMYSSNGYTYSYFYESKTVTENFYYPQAGTYFLGQMVVKF